MHDNNNIAIYLLPAVYYNDLVNELLKARNSEKELTFACALLNEKLKEKARKITVEDLTPGKTYGYLGMSHMATANRDGEMIPYHGEIYLYKTTFRPNFGDMTNVLISDTAWGTTNTKRISAGMLLIEY